MKKLAAIALLLVACTSTNKLHHGRVVSKHYEPESSYTVYHCTIRSKEGICLAQYPQTYTDPEEFRLEISECVESEHKGCVHETHLVGEVEWNAIKPGDLWSDGSGK